MRGCERLAAAGLVIGLWLGAPAPAAALDIVPAGEASTGEIFSLGFSAYKRGAKVEAFKALSLAAEKGHAGARWKLGQMFAQGDGVDEDDYQAFKMFERIVRDQDDDPSFTPNAAYVASAVVALAGYLRDGIPNSPVIPDLVQARQLYSHAASYFGDPEAQFELGRMLLAGEGGKSNPRQAARWLQLSARKGYAKAEALLGYLLFEGKPIAHRAEPARGLAMLTRAMQAASPAEREWIRPLQEEAFSLSTETQRRTALVHLEPLGQGQ
ncbi:tetratricopeptide repeat protein [Aureimonas populi]|uniref:Tetratricopeptide repeat protein n=1 Tax=Aureimonas populi TaxID=1701758 RepID=A0ABW5CF68_9HYPH|nr:tetratricopeptide repeat protein [Aureimonas populi]